MKLLRSLDPRFLRQTIDICLRFVAPSTLLNLLPIAFLFLVTGILDQILLIQLPGPVRALWWFLAFALVLSRFVIGAMEGKFNADLYESFPYRKMPGFIFRYFLASLPWMLPFGVIVFGILPIQEIHQIGAVEWFFTHIYLYGAKPFTPNFAFWLSLLGITALALAPLYSALIAGLAKSPMDVFQIKLWKHPFRNGAPPLLLPIGLFGSLATVFLMYLPVVGGLAFLAYFASRSLGEIIGSLTVVFPIMSWPIIAGRLAGTWVCFHPIDSEEALDLPDLDLQQGAPTSILPALTPKPLESATAVSSTPIQDTLSPQLAPIYGLIETDHQQAMSLLLGLKKQFAEDARIQGLEVRLLLKFNHRTKANSLAMSAVQALLKSPYASDIPALFKALGKERHALPWDSSQLDLLVKVFMDERDFKEAGWCAHICELQLGHSARAGKRLVQIADAASAAKDFDSSVSLLTYYIKHHPDGPFVDYAKKAVEFNQKQLATAASVASTKPG